MFDIVQLLFTISVQKIPQLFTKRPVHTILARGSAVSVCARRIDPRSMTHEVSTTRGRVPPDLSVYSPDGTLLNSAPAIEYDEEAA